MQGGVGNVFHALHQRNQRVAVIGATGGKAHAAIAHDGGGHALLRGGPQAFIPGGLPVKVRVHIDKAGGDDQTCGINGLAGATKAFFQVTAYGGNTPVFDRNIGHISGGSRSVHQLAIADQYI